MQEERFISQEQWGLPIGYDDLGNEITLEQYADMLDQKELGFRSLNIAEKAPNLNRLSFERVAKNDNYQPFIVGNYGEVDKDIAMKAIQANNELGKYLVRVEINTIRSVLKELGEKS